MKDMDNKTDKKEETSNIAEPAWKKALGLGLRYGLPVVLTVLLVIYMFKKVNFTEMLDLIRHGVDYWWILLAMFISIFSHVFRAARWRLQLKALGIKPPFLALCCSIFGCYALNLVFPRLGEVWRCTYIASSEKASFTSVLGSMIGDRLADTLMVFLLLLFSLVVAYPAIEAFLTKYPVGRDLVGLVAQWWFWAAIIGAALLCWWLLRMFRHTSAVGKLKEMALNMWKGFSVVASMKGRWMFLWLTLCIWCCYYFQLYVAFYAFDFTRELCHTPGLAGGLIPCLVAFVLSSIGMAIPSNGGLGPWNLAVMFGLAIYGVSDAQGTAFSMLQWSGQTVMLIILGIFTMIYISVSRKGGRRAASLADKTIEEAETLS